MQLGSIGMSVAVGALEAVVGVADVAEVLEELEELSLDDAIHLSKVVEAASSAALLPRTREARVVVLDGVSRSTRFSSYVPSSAASPSSSSVSLLMVVGGAGVEALAGGFGFGFDNDAMGTKVADRFGRPSLRGRPRPRLTTMTSSVAPPLPPAAGTVVAAAVGGVVVGAGRLVPVTRVRFDVVDVEVSDSLAVDASVLSTNMLSAVDASIVGLL